MQARLRPTSTPRRDPAPVEFIGAFESTYLPGHDVDVFEQTGHDRMWRTDIDALRELGVTRLRYPLRWHRIESDRGRYDWRHTDAVLAHLQDTGMRPIVDLVHHTSYPAWLDNGFADARFGPSYLAFADAVAQRYPWLTEYTLFNEPFATLFLAGHEGLWPPYGQGIESFVRVLQSVLPAVVEASRSWRELLPSARHVWVDTCEWHTGTPGSPAAHASVANDRRFTVLDLVLGHDLDPATRPFLRALVEAGGDNLLRIGPGHVDVLGLDYYPHSEWHYDLDGGHTPSPTPVGFATIAEEYAERYRLPVLLGETNIRGFPSDRATWLRYTLEQYETAARRGVPLEGYCWFPALDSSDWDSLLGRAAGRIDPVGIFSLGDDLRRRSTSLTRSYAAAVAGTPSAELPAYRLQSPAAERLAGFAAHMRGWQWEDPPPEEVVPPAHLNPAAPASTENSMANPSPETAAATADLVVLSHLRWSWVWQRPQHLLSRLARERQRYGRRTFFVEEPLRTELVDEPVLRVERHGPVERVWLEIPGPSARAGFGEPGTGDYAGLLTEYLDGEVADVWLYTPMALDIAEALEPRLFVYDVMDDLTSFAHAQQGLRLRQRRALSDADLVFAGGRTLHADVVRMRGTDGSHLFPSGVETAHYARSRELRRPHPRPVAGYVGVVDERLDLRLLADLAAELPNWDIEVVGPVAKIDPVDLPQAPNLRYLGMQPYERLPEVMAGFDVALMPFALNAATRSISPTKTLEYLAAGLPVVSTRVPDVVADFGSVVHLVRDGAGAAAACRHVLEHSAEERDARAAPIQSRHEWDVIAAEMSALMTAALAPTAAVPTAVAETAEQVSA